MGKRMDKPFWDSRRKAVWIPGARVWLDGRDVSPGTISYLRAEQVATEQGRVLPTRRDWLAIAYWQQEVNAVLRKECACPLTKTYWSQTPNASGMPCRYVADFGDGTLTLRGETADLGVYARGVTREEETEDG